jgi:hypothetical protein
MFQNKVNTNQAPGVLGDFASTNPFASVLAASLQLVAPAGGLTVGNFAWVGPAGQVSQSYVAGYQIGFLLRNEQALVTQFLGETSLVVPAGFPITLMNGGDYWAKFAAGATPGQNVYADPNTGALVAGATTPASAAGTATQGVTGTLTTVSGSANVTVNSVSAGILAVGDVVVSANIPAGTTVLSQTSVTAGSGAGLLGVYVLSAPASASAGPTAFTSNSTILNVTAVSTGAFNVGDSVTGSGTTQNIVSQAPQFQGEGTIAGTTALTITSVSGTSGKLRKGDVLVIAGVPAGTTVASQTSGTPGGVGVYVMSAAATGTAQNVPVTDANIPGSVGRYVTNVAQNVASGTVTVAGSYQATGFKVRGTYTAGPNELAKISTL